MKISKISTILLPILGALIFTTSASAGILQLCRLDNTGMYYCPSGSLWVSNGTNGNMEFQSISDSLTPYISNLPNKLGPPPPGHSTTGTNGEINIPNNFGLNVTGTIVYKIVGPTPDTCTFNVAINMPNVTITTGSCLLNNLDAYVQLEGAKTIDILITGKP